MEVQGKHLNENDILYRAEGGLQSRFLRPLQPQEQGVRFDRRVIRLRYRYRIDVYNVVRYEYEG